MTPNLAKAVIAVMKSVKGIDKSMTVGSGNMSYKGVPDFEVKKIIGAAMEANGLCILPIGVESKSQIDRWEETGGQYGPKQKQSVFTEVSTKYLLLHESGESVELAGYGHGVDSQDKGAGKATTYALKYTLLYTFLTPTGKIDDADNDHSDNTPAPPARPEVRPEYKLLTLDPENAILMLRATKNLTELKFFANANKDLISSNNGVKEAYTAAKNKYSN